MYVQCTMYCTVQSHACHLRSLNCNVSDIASVLTDIYCGNLENAWVARYVAILDMSNVSHTLAKYSLLIVAVCYRNIRRTVSIWLVCETFDNIYCSMLCDIPCIFSCIVLALHSYSQMWICIRCSLCTHTNMHTAHFVEWVDVRICSYNFHEIPFMLLSQFGLLFLASEPLSAVSSNPTQLAPRDECIACILHELYKPHKVLCQAMMLLWC